MNKLLFLLLFSAVFMNTHAQNRSDKTSDDYEKYRQQALQEYDTYKSKTLKDFNDFRDKANADFSDFMRRSWEEYRSFSALPVPKSPEPVKPPVVDPKKKPSNDPIPFAEIVPQPQPITPPQPVAPIPQPVQPAKQAFSFLFYNTECKVSLEEHQKIVLKDLSEQSVANAWNTLSDNQYNAVINDCLHLRKKLNLCDWGYIQLIKELSEKYYKTTTSNEAVLFQMYILTQSGYKVRIAKSGNRLALLIPSDQTIYEYTYFNIAGGKYYIIDKTLKGGSFNIFNQEFPKEQLMSLQIEQPQFAVAPTTTKSFASKRYPDVRVNVSTNKNLINFYNSYPVNSSWNLYANASISETLKKDLYPVLKNSIAGKSEADAANLLINFVQTAFEYQKDDEQFGYERPLFADETFFYPASDCEDRAIIYSILIKELLGLDVVLLHYPDHLATAVHFNSNNINGDYLTIENKKFIVCDPTYIGADIGDAMPQYKNVQAIVIKI